MELPYFDCDKNTTRILYLIGYDIGSSSIKASIVRIKDRVVVGTAQYPYSEMDIMSRKMGWAEQHPEVWWENLCFATGKLLEETGVDPSLIQSIGIAYQMHGLVLVNSDQQVLRPAIIWCDSRAVEIGNQAFEELGPEYCMQHLLNSPGNFTASKLKWVMDNEPEVFQLTDKFLLPGDFIAMKMTGEVNTTVQGLSEAILWDFREERLAAGLLEYLGIPKEVVPEVVPTFSVQGKLTHASAEKMGLVSGTPVTYRSGDQPNNAFSLGVINPGEVAATGGTSGVVYGVVDTLKFDPSSRINSFAHVNHCSNDPRIGMLLCINGAGIQYSWLKQQMAKEGTTYHDMERMISSVPVNSEGLRIIPFGNGSERILENKNPGAHIMNLHFNRHQRAHFYRAALEGIAFSFVYGMNILKDLGMQVNEMKVGNDNLFRSEVFSTTISALLNCRIKVMDTIGSAGAAMASGVAIGEFSNLNEVTSQTKPVQVYESINVNGAYSQAFELWKSDLEKVLKG